MKILFISDTHGYHRQLVLPDADILIHTGDVSGRGMKTQIGDFLEWFSEQPHKHKIMIAGNHDLFFEKISNNELSSFIPPSVTYLNDSGICIDGINIWGSPISTWFYNWAFNRHRGDDIKKHWDLIPSNTDILLTHGPAYGIKDLTHSGVHVGCELLLSKIKEIKPRIHAFGHIHEGYGLIEQFGVNFLNSAVLNAGYFLKNPPILFNW